MKNSKLRTILQDVKQGKGFSEKYPQVPVDDQIIEAEKAIRQAVGEEVLEHLHSTFRRDNCPASCDGYGTYATADEQGDPEPNQCQWCHEQRLPQLAELRQKIKQWQGGEE